MNAIELKHVNKRYDEFEIKDLCLEVPKGSIVGLVGENGAGKSTTIKLLMGAIKADSGDITVLGHNVNDKEFVNVRNDIGVVLDDAWFPETINVKQVEKIMRNTFDNWNEKVFWKYIDSMGISKDKKFRDYSRGMRMKLSIAVALSHEPKLLVLDEATAGLDPIVRDEITDLFYDFTTNEENSVLISSHIISDLEKICDYIAFIHNGRMVLFDAKDNLIEEYAIFVGTADQVESLSEDAVIHKEKNGLGGEKALVKRRLVPKEFELEKPTVEEVILGIVKGEAKR